MNLKIKLFFTSVVLLNISSGISFSQDHKNPDDMFPQTNSKGYVLGDPKNAVTDLERIYKIIQSYKLENGGNSPDKLPSLMNALAAHPKRYGFDSFEEAMTFLTNPDYRLTNKDISVEEQEMTVVYKFNFRRLDGYNLQSIRLRNTRDLIAWTDIYVYRNMNYYNPQKSLPNTVGFYVVLWDDGSIEEIPYDEALYYLDDQGYYLNYFRGQSDEKFSSLTYEEMLRGFPLLGKPTPSNSRIPVADNGGPESLVGLSRFQLFPDMYGIDRQQLWKVFDFTRSEFTLSEIRTGATKLGLSTQVETQTLAQLQKSGTPALLFLQDDGRIVTLAALDDDRAIVIDRGLTQNVERSVLEKRYSGEALVPTKALTQNAAIVADDAVREVKLPSLDAEVPQQFVLRNTGTTPITLQLEYPLLGVTESKLSKDIIAPGETATLDLKVKWRSILRAPYQNVLVSLQTNDPIVPRLQLAILLTPPAQTGN